MQTNFALAQLADPQTRESEKILRSCVHCGFCTATCPTYLLLGDELDSPRGRIYLIKDMLEGGKPASAEVVTHIDRCLSCLSCMTTCPSGVHYMHLIDHARAYIDKTFRRPVADRALRRLLVAVLPYRNRFRLALLAARMGKPLRPLLARLPGTGARLAAMLDLAPAALPSRLPQEPGRSFKSAVPGHKPRRVAMLTGCAQAVLRPAINAAAIRLLNRAGVDVVLPKREGCCGALAHHMGQEDAGLGFARHNIDVWMREVEQGGLDAILITASGCGTTVKDVPEGHICCGSAGTYNILQPEIAARLRARKVANIARTKPDVIATGNIGCMTQIGGGTDIPILHTIELLDWRTGGPVPEELEGVLARRRVPEPA